MAQHEHRVSIGAAGEMDVALPIQAIKTVFTPAPADATQAERRRWNEDMGVILGAASLGATLGGAFKGPVGVVVGFALGGSWATFEVIRRS
jgi:hypothetical protein